MAITPDGTKALVSIQNGSAITVLDITQPIIGPGYTVAVGQKPRGIAITPGGTRALVANSSSNTISVLDLTQFPIVQAYTVSVGLLPTHVAITPDGTTALVSNETDNTVSVLDMTPTVHLRQVIGSFANPLGIAVTPDGTKALVVSNGGDYINVIDLTQSILNSGYTVAVGSNPSDIAITSDGSKALVLNDSNVSVLDLTQPTIVPGYFVDLHGIHFVSIAITPDGARAYATSNGGGFVAVLDLTTTPIQFVYAIPLSSALSGIAITPDQAPTSLFSFSFDGLTVVFDGSGSSSPVGAVKEYIWDFGDGTSPITTTSRTVSHTYARSGEYAVSLTVVNDAGTSLDVTFTGQVVSNHGLPRARSVQVLNLPPPCPHKFVGEVRLHKHDRKVFMKTKWHPRTDKSTKKYVITARGEEEKVIKGRKSDHATIKLHPRHFPHKVSKKYRQYLHDKYDIQSVNAIGTTSQPVPVHVKH